VRQAELSVSRKEKMTRRAQARWNLVLEMDRPEAKDLSVETDLSVERAQDK
jgi:hypothetical protein